MRGMTQHGPASSATTCPCGLPAPYDDCCGRFHRGDAKAPTAERLMRSRFSAFCVGDEAYLLRTAPDDAATAHRPRQGPAVERAEEILQTSGGGFLDSEGTVRFRAHYVERGRAGFQEENSRFVVQDGAWLYVAPLTYSQG